jgi:hypothetical protein
VNIHQRPRSEFCRYTVAPFHTNDVLNDGETPR